jgi:hypothetical protein
MKTVSTLDVLVGLDFELTRAYLSASGECQGVDAVQSYKDKQASQLDCPVGK